MVPSNNTEEGQESCRRDGKIQKRNRLSTYVNLTVAWTRNYFRGKVISIIIFFILYLIIHNRVILTGKEKDGEDQQISPTGHQVRLKSHVNPSLVSARYVGAYLVQIATYINHLSGVVIRLNFSYVGHNQKEYYGKMVWLRTLIFNNYWCVVSPLVVWSCVFLPSWTSKQTNNRWCRRRNCVFFVIASSLSSCGWCTDLTSCALSVSIRQWWRRTFDPALDAHQPLPTITRHVS